MNTSDTSVLIINGSIRGREGNSGSLVRLASDFLQSKNVNISVLTLTDQISRISDIKSLLEASRAIFVVSGIYWNSWGSPLQRFIEVMTVYENTEVFFGKPFACAVTMDSVGGSGVAARLHAVFSGLGCWSPPCSTVIISRVGQEAILAGAERTDDPNEDVWRPEDIEVSLENLIHALQFEHDLWKRWPNIELKLEDGPWPDRGTLNLDSARYL